MKLPREFYIPKGARKITDKQSDAVAYAYEDQQGRPHAVGFAGKATKPSFNYRYRSDANRAKAIAEHFAGRQRQQSFKAQLKADRLDGDRRARETVQVGGIYSTCWGYEQTNVEYFEVVEVKGAYALLRELARKYIEDGFMSGHSVPLPGSYVGDAIRRRITAHGFKISTCRHASPASYDLVAGVKIYKPSYESSYA